MKTMAFIVASILSLSAIAEAPFDDAIQQALGGTKPDQMMATYLNHIAFENLARRAESYETIKTPEYITAWQSRKSAYFLEALGGFPDRTPLNAQVVGSGEGDGFRFEKILFESRPQFHVTAMLYLPVTPGPWPAVLMPCGHDANGKAADGYQRGCILLARNGIAALCYDPIGQGERVYYRNDDGSASLGATAEHTLFDVGAILTGTSIALYRIWDGMRAIDYLQSRTDIDANKIGVTGCSGGGTLSSYLMALDPRITAAAPSCYITSWKRILETIGPQDGEQNIFGQLKHGLDHADFIHLRAPRPTLLLTATRDFFDIEGSWDSFREAKRLYTRLGLPQNVEMVESDEEHGYREPHREAMAGWMQRWLRGVDAPVEEAEITVLADADVHCAPNGAVMSIEGARSVVDLNIERAETLKEGRLAFWRDTPAPEVLNQVRELTGIRLPGTLPPATATVLGERALATHRVEDLLIAIEPGIVLPARAWLPISGTITRARLIAPGDGLAAAQPIVDAGIAPDEAVLVVAVRGTGATENRKWGGAWLHVGNDFSDFMCAYINGLSFVGMRAEDLLQTASWWAETTQAPVSLYALGEATVPALHAAALAPDAFDHVTLDGGISTWQAVVEAARPHDQLINTVHHALAYYDLNDLESSLPTGKLHVLNAAVPQF
jgi:hypothetical protein